MATTPSRIPPIRREFLGWERPGLAEAARRLGARYRKGNALDLGNVIIVTPGKRAGRRLQELLAFLAEEEILLLTPPQVVTEGKLPESLYTPKLPFANEVTQDLAWARALREMPTEKRKYVVPISPAAHDVLPWLELGKVLRRVHVELAADGLDFSAVQKKGPNLIHFAETERWEALALLQQRYLALLDAQELWDVQTARLKAIEFHEIRTQNDIILLGTVDLNDSLRSMLDQIAERVTAYVVAPESEADRFDAHGCLAPDSWTEADIPLQDEQIRQVDGPPEQAEAVTDWLARLDGRFGSDEIAIGVPDESLVPQLQRQLEQSGVRARWVEGVVLGETSAYRLLATAVKFAGRRQYEDVAALVRHPDVEDWLSCGPITPDPSARSEEKTAVGLPAQLDRYYNARLPSRTSASSVGNNNEGWPEIGPSLQRMEVWLAEAANKHRLRDWGAIFCRILDAIYGGRTVQVDNPADEVLHRTVSRIVEQCDALKAIPEALDADRMAAADAFQIAIGPLAKEALPPPLDAQAVEILGWLELPLDDSRAVVVTSFNEGFVPQSTNADAFLPDRLRRELGILHNERRYARDAYAMTVLCHAREQLCCIVARRNATDEPLQPSRLVFACSDDAIVRRAEQFFAHQKSLPAPRRLLVGLKQTIPQRSQFEVPKAAPPKKALGRIGVNHFKAYLACPYRYYLRHVCKLVAVDDAARELDGSAFGILLHGTLSALGRDEKVRQSENEKDVFAFLEARLTKLAEGRYGGGGHRASIQLQIEQARHRLQAFAIQQVALVRDGWRIIYAEEESHEEARTSEISAPFSVNGHSINLVGRIDRIDYHEGLHRVRILDYKTADKAETPDKTHRRGEEWIDLQLPLYRHLWRTVVSGVEANCEVEFGYFNLPKRLDATRVETAVWDEDLLASSDATARSVIRDLWAGKFEIVYPPPDFSDDLAAICLDNVYCGPSLADDEGGTSQ